MSIETTRTTIQHHISTDHPSLDSIDELHLKRIQQHLTEGDQNHLMINEANGNNYQQAMIPPLR